MKKILSLFAVIALLMTSCQKEEPIEPVPKAIVPITTTTTTSGTGTNSNPPSPDNTFYLSFHTNSLQNVSRLALTEMVPEVIIDGIPLTYIGKDGLSWTQQNITNMSYEYEIPPNVNMVCNDSIDFTVTYDNDSMVGINIYAIQVHHVKTEIMYYKPYSPSNPLVITDFPPNYIFEFTDMKVICD